MEYDFDNLFPRYEQYDPAVPVWCVTPRMDRTIHRFFDTSPFSPSGRFVGLTRLPFEDRLPEPGDLAEIILVDLTTGEERVVAETCGWDTQLGAQVQWGATDNQLFFNDLDTTSWKPYGVVIDPLSGTRRVLDGTVYMVSPDGRWIVSPNLTRIGLTQRGYGVHLPEGQVYVTPNLSDEDGIFLTDVTSGKVRLLISHKEIVKIATPKIDPDEFRDGTFISFHVKWNPKGDRLLLVLRWVPHQRGTKRRAQLVTMKADGTGIRVALPASIWDRGGHHPNWCPDGETLMMNLRVNGKQPRGIFRKLIGKLKSTTGRLFSSYDNGMRIIQIKFDGSDFRVMNDAVIGTGHPSLHPNGRHVITDVYPNEPLAFGDGTTPIRLIDLDTGHDISLVRIQTVPPHRGIGNELRVDPHPVWDRQFRYIAFNACAEGTRRVYVADLTGVLE